MTIEGAPGGPESKRPLAKCAEHGLHFDSTQHSGCVVCRRGASQLESGPPPPVLPAPELSLPELSLPELPIAPALDARPAPLLMAKASQARPRWVPIGLVLGGLIVCAIVYYSVRLALLGLGVGTVAHTTLDGTITLRAPASWKESENARSKPDKVSVILWHQQSADIVDTIQFSSEKLDEPLPGSLADQMPELKAVVEKTASCMSVQPATVAGTPGFQTVCTEKVQGEQKIAFHLFASSRMHIHHFAVSTNSLDTSPLQSGPLKWVAEAKLNVEP